MPPEVGSIDPGMAIVGTEDPVLYVVKWLAIIVMLAAVLVIVCDPSKEAR